MYTINNKLFTKLNDVHLKAITGGTLEHTWEECKQPTSGGDCGDVRTTRDGDNGEKHFDETVRVECPPPC